MYHRTKIFFGLFLAWIIADLPLHAAQKNVVPPPQRILIKDRKDLRKQNRLPAAPKKIAVQKTPVKKAVPAKKPAAQTKSTTLKTYTINKNSYVDLNDAAKYYKAKLTVSGKSLRLSSKSCNIAFEVGKRSGSINGTAVTFSFAPVKSGNRHYISLIDFTKTLIPALSAKLPQRKLMKIMIDPGHGGNDSGVISIHGAAEKHLNLLLAQTIANELKKSGFEVFLTREKDIFIPLDKRVENIAKDKVDLFISIHHNSAPNPKASGLEIFLLDPQGENENQPVSQTVFLALSLHDKLAPLNYFPGRGVKLARFKVLRLAKSPAMLIEAGFLNHPVESAYMATAHFRKKFAVTLAQEITAFAK